MLVHNNPLFSIYFGNSADNIRLMQDDHFAGTQLLTMDPYKKLKKLLHIEHLIFLKQMHTTTGMIITSKHTVEPFVHMGDYLITNQNQYGIGVMTADCLPIIFYDHTRHVAAIAHAGWKGSIKRIAPHVINVMQETFDTQINQLRIFFGPSAKSCCYQVGPEFYEHVSGFSFGQQTLYKHNHGKITFDLPLFNRLQLEEIGIAKEAVKTDYNVCTICDQNYWSNRSDTRNGGKQMTVIALK